MLDLELFFLENENEDIIYEGLFKNNIPNDIKDLKNDLKSEFNDYNKEFNKKYKEMSITNRYSTINKGILNKEVINKILNKLNIDILQYNVTDAGNARTHFILGIFKDYIIEITINETPGQLMLSINPNVNIKYDKNTCKIPKDVVFNIIKIIGSDHIHDITCSDIAVSIAINYQYIKHIEEFVSKMQDKYDKEYTIYAKNNKVTGSSIIIYRTENK